MHERRIIHVRMRLLQLWLHVGHISDVWIAAILVLERHGAINEVDALHVLLLQSLVKHVIRSHRLCNWLIGCFIARELHIILHTFILF